jgi:hypothetical protein
MHILLPAGPTGAQFALAGPIAGDAMADPIEPTEHFDVDVDSSPEDCRSKRWIR